MKVSDIPHNMGITLNEDLVECAESPEEMREGIAFLLDELAKAEEPVAKGQVASMIGVYSRVIGDLEASEKMLSEAHDHFKEANKTLLTYYAKSRLAVTLAAAQKYAPSDEKFQECIDTLTESGKSNPSVDKIVIYCMDQWARSKFARKFYQDALDIFLEAHEREMIHGDLENMNQLSSFISKLKKKIESEQAEQQKAEEERRQMEEDFKNRTDV